MFKITTGGNYRMGNAMFINIGGSIVAEKLNLKADYPKKHYTDSMNINLFQGGVKYENIIHLDDSNILTALSGDFPKNTGIEYNGFFQLSAFIYNYSNEILAHFPVISGKTITDEVFCTIRLDDEKHQNPGINYYRDALNICACEKGYISTDEPSHSMIKDLSKEYNLTILSDSADNKMKLSRNFDNIVLSHGTYSWWIGFLSNGKNIIYPEVKEESRWFGDIFHNPNWTELKY